MKRADLLVTTGIASDSVCWASWQRQGARPTPTVFGRLTSSSTRASWMPPPQTLTEYMERHSGDADAAAMDLAMVQLVSGKPAEAEKTLRSVRDNLDELEQKDALESGLSLLTDDQRLAYCRRELRKGPDASLSGPDESAARRSGCRGVQPAGQRQAGGAAAEGRGRREGQGGPRLLTLAIAPYLRGVIREVDVRQLRRCLTGLSPGGQLAAGIPGRASGLWRERRAACTASRDTVCCTSSRWSIAGR